MATTSETPRRAQPREAREEEAITLVGCVDTGREFAEDTGKRSPVVLKGKIPLSG